MTSIPHTLCSFVIAGLVMAWSGPTVMLAAAAASDAASDAVTNAASNAAFTDATAPLTVPANFHFCQDIRANLGVMWRTSPTFRQQFERLAASPRLVISGRVSASLVGLSVRASSSIHRDRSGQVAVSIEIRPGPDEPQWIAHELEHVIEYLDGVPLRARAEHGRLGAWYSGVDMIETDRAVLAGTTVRQEMRRRLGRSDKFAD